MPFPPSPAWNFPRRRAYSTPVRSARSHPIFMGTTTAQIAASPGPAGHVSPLPADLSQHDRARAGHPDRRRCARFGAPDTVSSGLRYTTASAGASCLRLRRSASDGRRAGTAYANPLGYCDPMRSLRLFPAMSGAVRMFLTGGLAAISVRLPGASMPRPPCPRNTGPSIFAVA